MSAAYVPWEIHREVEVPVSGASWNVVVVPWVAARDAEAFARTAAIVALLTTQAIMTAQALAQKRIGPPDALRAVLERRYDPPMVRFGCPSCGDTWDAWVADDGHLQDKRDAVCTNDHCQRYGHPAEPVKEE